RVELEDANLYERVDLTRGFIPACIRGTMEIPDEHPEPATLAIAVNGTIHAVCRSFGRSGGRAQWMALVPDSAFRAGANEITVFHVSAAGLERTVQRSRNGEALPSSFRGLVDRAGKPLRIVPRSLAGSVDELRVAEGCLEIAGWAADTRRGELPNAI